MTIDYRKLTQVLTVAQQQSFSIAARELGLTQSALSRSVASLEAEWGFQIFRRTRNGLVLTDQGKQCLEQAAKLVADAASFDHNMHLLGNRNTGSLAFGTGRVVASMFMTKLLREANKEFPHYNIRSAIGHPDDLVSKVQQGQYEFAIFADGGTSLEHNLNREQLCEVPHDMLVAPDHPILGRDSTHISDIQPWPILAHSFTNLRDIEDGCIIQCDDINTSIDMTRRSQAAWYTCPWLVWEELQRGEFEVIKLNDELLLRPQTLSIFTAQGRNRSPAATFVLNCVKRQVQTMQEQIPTGKGSLSST